MTDKEIWSVVSNNIRKINPYNKYPHNSIGFSHLFADVCKDVLRLNREKGKIYYYDKGIWQEDTKKCETMRYIKVFPMAMYHYSNDIKAKVKYRSLIGKLASFYHRDNMLKDFCPHHYLRDSELNINPMLLNCLNGTFNLETMKLQPFNPDDKITKRCNVEFAQNAQCPKFEKFISEVMQSNKEKILYLQKVIGYSLTGLTNHETCFILYGQSTRNGKSTLIETLSYLLGDENGYALSMSPETLSQKQSGAIRSDLARLHGCRFLNASEPPKRMIFDIGLLKALLGNDSITARKLYENEVQFRPIFKLFINTNYLPYINDDTIFSSNRVNVITFDQHFYAHDEDGEPKQNHNLKKELKAELSGILNWCLKGLKIYKKDGHLIPPQCVKNATKEYREQSDKLNNFLKDCVEDGILIADKSEKMPAGKIYELYSDWCEKSGFGTENKSNFFAELKVKGLYAPLGTVGLKSIRNVIVGYKLAPLDESFFVDDKELLREQAEK